MKHAATAVARCRPGSSGSVTNAPADEASGRLHPRFERLCRTRSAICFGVSTVTGWLQLPGSPGRLAHAETGSKLSQVHGLQVLTFGLWTAGSSSGDSQIRGNLSSSSSYSVLPFDLTMTGLWYRCRPCLQSGGLDVEFEFSHRFCTLFGCLY